MDPAQAYQPSTDFNTAYDALTRRINATFANRLGQAQQDVAARGVATSGVGTLPAEAINREKDVALNSAAGDFAREQAETSIADRRRAEDFSRQKDLMAYGSNLQDSLQRRLAKSQLTGQLIGGGIGALGSLGGGWLSTLGGVGAAGARARG